MAGAARRRRRRDKAEKRGKGAEEAAPSPPPPPPSPPPPSPPHTDDDDDDAAAAAAESAAAADVHAQRKEMRTVVAEAVAGVYELDSGPIPRVELVFNIVNAADKTSVEVCFQWYNLQERGGALLRVVRAQPDMYVNLRHLATYPPKFYKDHEEQWRTEHFYRTSPMALMAHKPTTVYGLPLCDVFAALGHTGNFAYTMKRLAGLIAEVFSDVPLMPKMTVDMLFPTAHASEQLEGRAKSKARRVFPAVLLPFLLLIAKPAYYGTIVRALHSIEMDMRLGTEHNGSTEFDQTYRQFVENHAASSAFALTTVYDLEAEVSSLRTHSAQMQKQITALGKRFVDEAEGPAEPDKKRSKA